MPKKYKEATFFLSETKDIHTYLMTMFKTKWVASIAFPSSFHHSYRINHWRVTISESKEHVGMISVNIGNVFSCDLICVNAGTNRTFKVFNQSPDGCVMFTKDREHYISDILLVLSGIWNNVYSKTNLKLKELITESKRKLCGILRKTSKGDLC